MNALNSLIIEGNLVKDANIKELPSGMKVCEMTLAVNRSYKASNGQYENEVSYFDVSSFGKVAEYSAEKGKKGSGTRVVGRLKQERWQSQNGKPCSKVILIAEHVEFKQTEKNEPVDQKIEDVEIPVEEGFNIGF